MDKNKKESYKKAKVVVGIDFGTSGTGYAYSYDNPNKIILGNFPRQGHEFKVPTEIILDSKFEKIKAFGVECKEYVENNQLKNGELYFKAIKMNLYKKVNEIKPQNSTETYQIVDIIAKILEYVKEIIIKKINDGYPDIMENQIKWVVTVPSIWDYFQREIMIQASEKVGFFNEFTNTVNFLALEAEAASLYCSKDNTIDLKYLENGKSYILCDLGGGTGDIVTHKKENNGKIKEISPPEGGNFGSDEIDKRIYNKVFYKIFKFKDFNDLKKKNKEIGTPFKEEILLQGWLAFLEEIQKKKKITKNSEGKTFNLNCQLFENFIDKNKLQDAIDEYNKSVQKDWEIKIHTKLWLTIPYKIFFDLINEHAKEISNKLNKIYENNPDIESILFVGGYSSNEILLNSIKSNTNFKNVVYLFPSKPLYAVVEGAVLFGLEPDIVELRKAPYTIGFNADLKWDERIHGGKGEKIFNEALKIYQCKNAFDKFIEIGQDIYYGQCITQNFSAKNSRYIYLKFFKTKKKNPILFTEDNVELLGKAVIDLEREYPINERNFEVTLEIGGTYIDAKCIHNISHKEKNIKLYFN